MTGVRFSFLMNKVKLLCMFCFLQLLFANFVFSDSDYIVAIVNEDVITQSELDNNLSFVYIQMSEQLEGEQLEEEFSKYKDEVLTRMIEDKLILQEAKQRGLQANEDIVRERVAGLKAQFDYQEEFNSFLIGQGLTLRDIKERFRNEILMKGIIDMEVKSKIIIHPKEITNYYKKNIKEFKEPEGLAVDFISVPSEKKEELEKDLADLNSFDLLVDLHEESKGRIIVHHDEFRKEVEEAIYNLEIEEMTPPLEIDSTVYIFRLVGKIKSRTRPLEDVQHYIREKLKDMDMQEELTKWFEELKKDAYIIIK